jgi:RNA polymerase sigma factor (sigma-70 family)
MTGASLLARYKAGDETVLNDLWVAYMPRARRAVANMGKDGRYADHGDLEAWAYEGLLDAIKRFDPTLGKQFEHYAWVRIRGFVRDRLRQQRSRSTKANAHQRVNRPGTHYAGPPAEMDLAADRVEDALERQHAMTEIARAVSQIPMKHQASLFLWLSDDVPKSREALMALREQLLEDRCRAS